MTTTAKVATKLSSANEDYLEAIYQLSEAGRSSVGGSDGHESHEGRNGVATSGTTNSGASAGTNNHGTKLVRSVDLATKLEVSKASVNNAIKNLKSAGMIEQVPYGDITLTPKGERYARSVLDRHRVLYHFLIDVLEVEPQRAALEACEMEHAISDDTLERLTKHLKAQLKL